MVRGGKGGSYLQRVKAALRGQKGAEVAGLLNVSSAAVQQQGAAVEAEAAGGLPAPFDVIVSSHVACASLLAGGGSGDVQAYAELAACVPAFVDWYRAEDTGAWAVQVLHALVGNVRKTAERADDWAAQEAARKGLQGKAKEAAGEKKLENAGNLLMSLFAAANRPQGDPAKRLGTLRVVNELFRIYFKLNTLRNCKYLIRVVEAKKFVRFESFHPGDRVTYKFFVGRLAVFDENFTEAEAHLQYAFDKCTARARKNRRLILKYLVPVKILVGKLPSSEVLARHQLEGMYAAVAQAVRSGSVRGFETAVQERMEEYVRAGTFLLIEKLRMAVYRRLLKKVQRIHAELKPERGAQLPLKYFVKALGWQGHATDMDEVECIVANMIYRGLVKGYVSHTSGVVVLSKKEPFPALKSTMLDDPE